MPEESQPLTVDAARQEREQIGQLLQRVPSIRERGAFLEGFLAAHEALAKEIADNPTSDS
jgi:hypothetical protein